MKSLFFTFVLISSNIAFAGITKDATITGRIIKFNARTVTLSQKGRHTKVLRKSIPKHFKIKVGNKVFAVIDSKKTLAELKSALKK